MFANLECKFSSYQLSLWFIFPGKNRSTWSLWTNVSDVWSLYLCLNLTASGGKQQKYSKGAGGGGGGSGGAGRIRSDNYWIWSTSPFVRHMSRQITWCACQRETAGDPYSWRHSGGEADPVWMHEPERGRASAHWRTGGRAEREHRCNRFLVSIFHVGNWPVHPAVLIYEGRRLKKKP